MKKFTILTGRKAQKRIENPIQFKTLGKRIGLIQARNLGAKFASGRVL